MTTDASHFVTEGGGTPISGGRFVDVHAVAPFEILPGLEFRPVLGQQTITNFVRFEPNTEAPMHSHEEEQIVLVLDGEFEFEIDGQGIRLMRAGDVAVIPSWVRHGARTKDTSCFEVDFFTPPRSTLLEHATGQVDASQVTPGQAQG